MFCHLNMLDFFFFFTFTVHEDRPGKEAGLSLNAACYVRNGFYTVITKIFTIKMQGLV